MKQILAGEQDLFFSPGLPAPQGVREEVIVAANGCYF